MTPRTRLIGGAILAVSVLPLGQPAMAADALFDPPVALANGPFGSGQGHGSIVSADLDGDLYADLAAVDTAAGAVRVYANDGAGGFGAPASFSTGFAAGSLDAADLDGDGDIDLAVTSSTSSRFGPPGLVLLINDGTGTFTKGASYLTGSGPVQVKAADFDSDGRTDLATIGAEPFQNLVIMLNQGDATFKKSQTLTVGLLVLSMETADINGDGTADLLVGDGPTGVIPIVGAGDGTFAKGAIVRASFGIEGFATGDLDGDGNVDVVIPELVQNKVSVHLGAGDGTFGPAISSTVNPASSLPPTINVAAHVADLDGDGVSDVVVSGGADSHVYAMLGDGTGRVTFGERHPVRVPRSFASADFDHDGTTDVAVTGPQTAVLLHR